MVNTALVVVTRAVNTAVSPAIYEGLAQIGESVEWVKILLPYGVRKIYPIPSFIFVPCDDTYVSYDQTNNKPYLTINDWSL